jgi:hypothetical protein
MNSGSVIGITKRRVDLLSNTLRHARVGDSAAVRDQSLAGDFVLVVGRGGGQHANLM